MILDDAGREVNRLSKLLEKGLDQLRDSAQEVAEAERAYRKAKAVAWVEHTEGTAAFREAQVNAATSDLRYTRDLADGTRRAALEAVRSRQTQISAIQSLLNAHRAEADFAKTGPQ